MILDGFLLFRSSIWGTEKNSLCAVQSSGMIWERKKECPRAQSSKFNPRKIANSSFFIDFYGICSLALCGTFGICQYLLPLKFKGTHCFDFSWSFKGDLILKLAEGLGFMPILFDFVFKMVSDNFFYMKKGHRIESV